MPLERFIPKSPDPNIRNSQDFEVAKFGHLNTIIEYVNTYVVTDSLQLSGTGPLTSTARYITDSLGNASSLAISSGNIGIGTTNATARLRVISADTNGIAEFFQNGATSSPLHLTRYTGLVGINLNTAAGGSTSPVPVGDGIQMSRITTNTYNGTAFGVSARIEVIAKGIQSATNYGSHMRFQTTPENNINLNTNLALLSDGNVQIGADYNVVLGAKLGIKGSGSTSATTALLVQNSNGNKLFEILDSQIANAFMYSFPMTNNGGLTLKSNVGTTETPALFLRPNTGLNGANIYVLDNKIYFRLINTNQVGSDSVYVFATDNRKAKLGVTPDDSIYDSSIYAKAIWDGGVAGHFRTFSATQTANVLEVANNDNSQNYINVSANGNLRIGNGAVDTARTSIKGSGSTSATTALLVQNSGGTQSLKVTDSGLVNVGDYASNFGALAIPFDGVSFGTKPFIVTQRDGIALLSMISNTILEISAPSLRVQPIIRFQNVNTGLSGPDAQNINQSSILLSGAVNAYNGISQNDACNLVYIQNRGTTLQAAGSINWIKMDGVVNEAGGGGNKWCTGIYYNPTLTGGSLLDNSHYCYHATSGQMMVNTTSPQSSAQLQVDSITRGFLPPRMTTTQRTAIVLPAAGLIVYDTDTNKSYTYDGTAWQAHW